ncbi:hypothetical protein H112_00573 [Trichophyton rubrum D6]|uniref:Uncharacterized protein n=3 Tax=Trichophyton TaxID=5550 RepID=F2T048_TRIRC|nr:uncharacterized protein TERG_08186 [Trichophyton rubrum CBS 118892]EZF27475.1 hypothetical protein H100_00572 [Trichophyton rubrum MR850]EZF46504.1 hypothetical protein H102_00571 [Trichophyton rubrum CBS 100081]EZF57163.1 hypothetical protein H103_00572 [Trichophyton rubrum CBS 288.86]EZF67732.1 hypothetical protein H104_00562 [Trichophyton rubrum CBS 289.86]EZF78406.1 hypothetical protein H105_00560 [Trichophyton soudanense CBS 452.61]EZF89102.1 hypothetical protein H110_00576 [Trichophy
MQSHVRTGTATKVEKVQVLLATTTHAGSIRWWPTKTLSTKKLLGLSWFSRSLSTRLLFTEPSISFLQPWTGQMGTRAGVTEGRPGALRKWASMEWDGRSSSCTRIPTGEG